MDEFYEIVYAQSNDEEFKKLSNSTAGTLTRRLGNTEEPTHRHDPETDGDALFQCSLTEGDGSNGTLKLYISEKMSPQSVLDLMDHVRGLIEQAIEDQADDDGDEDGDENW